MYSKTVKFTLSKLAQAVKLLILFRRCPVWTWSGTLTILNFSWFSSFLPCKYWNSICK